MPKVQLAKVLTARWRGKRYNRGTTYTIDDNATFRAMLGSGLFKEAGRSFPVATSSVIPVLGRRGEEVTVIRDMGLGDLLMLLPAMFTVTETWPQIRLTLATTQKRVQLLTFPWLFSTVAIEDLPDDKPAIDLRWLVERHSKQREITRPALFAQALGVAPSGVPILLPERSGERTEALRILFGSGWTADQPLAVVALRGSAGIRTYNPGLNESLVSVLTDLGIWVVLTDLDPSRGWSGPGIVDMTGMTPLGLLAEVTRLANVAIGPDSGLIHIAASVDTPSVAIFTTWRSGLRVADYNCLAFEPVELDCFPCNDGGCSKWWCTMWIHPLEIARAVCEVLAPRWNLTVPGDPPGVRSTLRRYGSPRTEEKTNAKILAGAGTYVPSAILG